MCAHVCVCGCIHVGGMLAPSLVRHDVPSSRSLVRAVDRYLMLVHWNCAISSQMLRFHTSFCVVPMYMHMCTFVVRVVHVLGFVDTLLIFCSSHRKSKRTIFNELKFAVFPILFILMKHGSRKIKRTRDNNQRRPLNEYDRDTRIKNLGAGK